MYSRMSWEATSGLMPIGAQHGGGRRLWQPWQSQPQQNDLFNLSPLLATRCGTARTHRGAPAKAAAE